MNIYSYFIIISFEIISDNALYLSMSLKQVQQSFIITQLIIIIVIIIGCHII